MGYSHKYIMAVGFLITSFLVFGQKPGLIDSSLYVNRIIDANPRVYQRHDTMWIYSGICKTLKRTMLTGEKTSDYFNGAASGHDRQPFLKIHGTVQYDFTFRSFVDTPFAQRDFAQHSIQASIDLVIRDNYPIKLVLLNRRSNSPYFDDMTDINVQFSHETYWNGLKDKVNKKMPAAINTTRLSEAELFCKRKQWEAESLQSWINHPARLQEIIEEKEKLATNTASTDMPQFSLPGVGKLREKSIGKADSVLNKARSNAEIKIDSLVADKKEEKDSLSKFPVLAKFQQKRSELEKVLQELKVLDKKVKDVKRSIQDSVSMLRQELTKINDPGDLKNFIAQHKLQSGDLPKGWQTFAVINTIGIGKTWVDCSDLTVKNISLTGINSEINPSRFYLAFAAGRINYRFRDFVVKNNDLPRQSLYLVRAGIGKKDGNNFILTWFDGKRNLLNSFGSSIISINPEKVIGVSAQSRLQVDADNYVIMEVAKSSFHATGTVSQDGENLIKKVGNFKDRSNEAYSIRVSSHWPKTGTKLTGYYRKMGEHFQSFNLQPVNADQEAYQIKVQQSFLKRKFTLEAGIRKNDFNNPFINPGLTSKTIFKTLQATLRVPKYPFVSIGYYPSSQLTVLNNNVIAENQYNTLSAVVGYVYRIRYLSMSSNLVYLKFYNSGADTGFIYYNASSITMNQYFFWKNLQLESGVTFTGQRELKVLTLEQSVRYHLLKWLTINGTVKYNRVNHEMTLWGGSGGIGLLIKRFGTIQASYDKSYLPGQSRDLLPVDMGRVSYFRSF